MFPFGKIISGIPWQYAQPIKLASASLCLDIDHTTAASSGTVYAVDIDSTNTANGINNYRAFAVDLTMGANCNGPYAGYFRTDIADATVGGLSAALGLEVVLSSVANANGECHGMTFDFSCPSGSNIGTGTNKHSFIKLEIWGDTTAKNNFDDNANIFFLNGMTSGAGNLVSANETTLRINIEGTSRYLVLSSAENSLTIDGAGDVADHAISIGGTTAYRVDGTPDYAVEIKAAPPGGSTSFLNIGAINATNTCPADFTNTGQSFTTAVYGRLEFTGGASTELGNAWYVANLGYFKTTGTNAVSATSAVNAAVCGLVNVSSGYTQGSGSYLAGVMAGSYGGNTAHGLYCGFACADIGGTDFDYGMYIANGSCTTGIYINAGTHAITVEGSADHLLRLYVANGCVATNTETPAVATSHDLVIDIDGVDHYIPVYSDRTWGS